jgi:hypothetical protein
MLILSNFSASKRIKRCSIKHTKQQQGAFRPPSSVVDFLFLDLILGVKKKKGVSFSHRGAKR